MRYCLAIGLVLVMLGALACKDESAAGRPSAGDHRQFAMVFDISCASVQDQVRATMRADPGLGLATEREAPLGVALVTPEHKGDQRRWSATVLIQCADSHSARLEVRVKAERLANGAWEPAGDAPRMEKDILDKVLPKP
ncbi:MAG: hypothetical protein K9K66_03255 [Desulfarculaceae bacterium]|nr:hypothetical protein [Desulfarculaceae bacterium]MCF8071065.1 hypothetical protein [Desulfarculaceae bacterium]MCF8100653.1 hypothetical protein [Desulfarculaceae bacterium]MCF8116913.1 hypothetical protein [Desulfarculaceae bacterium]